MGIRNRSNDMNDLYRRTALYVDHSSRGRVRPIMRRSRTPDILADAAHLIFTKPAKSFTGQFLIDDTFLAGEGVTDFDAYRVDPSQPLSPDFFVPDSSKPPPGVSLAAKA